jgi:post-segregation antitoxin (ccd killing protein)
MRRNRELWTLVNASSLIHRLITRSARTCVCVCVARVNVYLPDDLAQRAKAAGLSISAVTQNALRSALTAGETDRWLDRLEQLPAHEVSHDVLIRTLDDVRDEFGT